MSKIQLLDEDSITELAHEAVCDMVKQIPENVSPDEEKDFLINSGRMLTRAALIIKEMLAAKDVSKLN